MLRVYSEEMSVGKNIAPNRPHPWCLQDSFYHLRAILNFVLVIVVASSLRRLTLLSFLKKENKIKKLIEQRKPYVPFLVFIHFRNFSFNLLRTEWLELICDSDGSMFYFFFFVFVIPPRARVYDTGNNISSIK